MTNAAKIIIEQAKALPVADREDIFEAMLVSLREVPPGDVDDAWRALLDERLAALDRGELETFDFEEAAADLRRK